jgi:hypothetical protein
MSLRLFVGTLAAASVLPGPAVAASTGEGLRMAALLTPSNDLTCRAQPAKEAAFLGALVGAIALPLVKAGIKGLGGALSKVGEGVSTTVSGDVAGSFYRISEDGGLNALAPKASLCLLIAAGAGNGEGPAPQLEGANFGLKTLGFTGAPAFAMVAAIEIAPDKTAWRLVPWSLYMGKPLTRGGTFRSAKRDLVLQLALFGATAKTADDAAVATRAMILGRQADRDGPILQSQQGIGYLATSWMPLPPVPEAVAAQVVAANQRRTDRQAMEIQKAAAQRVIQESKDKTAIAKATETASNVADQIARLDKAIAADDKRIGNFASDVGPFSLGFRLVETRDGSKFLRDFGTLLADNAETIAKPIADAISPEARQAAADAQLQKALAAVGAETDSRVAAIEGVAAWQAAGAAGKPAAETDVLRLKASAACRKLELAGFAEVACLAL